MLFLYLLALAITILIEYIVANAFYDIACEKGFENRKYFWYSFLLSFVGYLMVIALPDRKKETHPRAAVQALYREPAEQHMQVKRQETTASAHQWRCNQCGKMITETPCPFCEKN